MDPRVLHEELSDYPSSRRFVMTMCGQRVVPTAIAPTIDAVTCPKCLQARDEYERAAS